MSSLAEKIFERNQNRRCDVCAYVRACVVVLRVSKYDVDGVTILVRENIPKHAFCVKCK